jgi:hypothetical protein
VKTACAKTIEDGMLAFSKENKEARMAGLSELKRGGQRLARGQ